MNSLTLVNGVFYDRDIRREVSTGTIAAGTTAGIMRHIKVPPNMIATIYARAKVSAGTNTAPLAVTVSGNVFTATAHGYTTGQPLILGGTTAPTGLTLGNIYYAIVLTANTFSLASTAALALAGTAISLSSAGTAVTVDGTKQTAYFEAVGVARNLNGVVALVGTPTITTYKDSALAAWAVTIVANNVNANPGVDVCLTSDVNLSNYFEVETETITDGL